MKVAIYNVVTTSLENAVISISSALATNPNLTGYIFLDFKIFENVNFYQDVNPDIKFLDLNDQTVVQMESNKLIKYIDFEDNHMMFFNLNQYFIDEGFDYTIYTHENNIHLAEFGDIYNDQLLTAAQMCEARRLKKVTNKFIYSEKIKQLLFYNDKFMVFNLAKIMEYDLFNEIRRFVENYYYLVEEYDTKKVIEQYPFINILNKYLGKIQSHQLISQQYLVETTSQYPYSEPGIVIHQNLEFNYFGPQMRGYEEIRHNFFNVFVQLEYIEVILEYILLNIERFPTITKTQISKVQDDLDAMIFERNTKYQEVINGMFAYSERR